MKTMTRPTDDRLGGRLINLAFNLYDRDFLNGREPDVSISQRVQLVVDQYERHKHELYDCVDYVI
jgi:hypothetical protein